MNEAYFTNIKDIGDLYLEQVFNIFEEENIIFVCMDTEQNRYLCVCYEIRYNLEWAIRKIPRNILVDFLKKRIDMYTAFQLSDGDLIQYVYDGNKEWSKTFLIEEFDKNLLPEKGVYLIPDIDVTNYLLKLLYDDDTATCLEINCNFNSIKFVLQNEPSDNIILDEYERLTANFGNTFIEGGYNAFAA